MAGMAVRQCVFCQIAQGSTSTTLLYKDDRIVVFPDINPSAFRHYLAVPIQHISTVENLQRTAEDHDLVKHMLDVGQSLLCRDAPQSTQYRWREIKYLPLGFLPGFMDAERCLARIKH